MSSSSLVLKCGGELKGEKKDRFLKDEIIKRT